MMMVTRHQLPDRCLLDRWVRVILVTRLLDRVERTGLESDPSHIQRVCWSDSGVRRCS